MCYLYNLCQVQQDKLQNSDIDLVCRTSVEQQRKHFQGAGRSRVQAGLSQNIQEDEQNKQIKNRQGITRNQSYKQPRCDHEWLNNNLVMSGRVDPVQIADSWF